MRLIFYMYPPQHAASLFLSLSWLPENLTLQRNHIAEECNTLISASNV